MPPRSYLFTLTHCFTCRRRHFFNIDNQHFCVYDIVKNGRYAEPVKVNMTPNKKALLSVISEMEVIPSDELRDKYASGNMDEEEVC